MKILITGGCGYTGSVLVENLLKDNHKVTVVDAMWFGNPHKSKKNLKIIKMDIRNYDKIPLRGINTVVHLANIANDPAVELNPTLSWEVNVLSSYKIANLCLKHKIKKFSFPSSSSIAFAAVVFPQPGLPENVTFGMSPDDTNSDKVDFNWFGKMHD